MLIVVCFLLVKYHDSIILINYRIKFVYRIEKAMITSDNLIAYSSNYIIYLIINTNDFNPANKHVQIIDFRRYFAYNYTCLHYKICNN